MLKPGLQDLLPQSIPMVGPDAYFEGRGGAPRSIVRIGAGATRKRRFV
jgi:hypothetical protein